MKNHLIGAALLATGILFAQSEAKAQGGYFKLGAAYNMGVGSEQAANTTNIANYSGSGSPTYTYTTELVKVNYGKGLVPQGTFGYMFNEHIGAELGIGYLLGGKNETIHKRTETMGNNTSVAEMTEEAHSRMVLFQPAIVISAGMEGINPYARFGMVAAKGSVILNHTEITNGKKDELEVKVSDGWGLGLQGGLGVDFKLNDNMSFFTELSMSNLNYSPNKGEITKATEDGVDVLQGATTRQKEINYVKDLTFSNNDVTDDSKPGSDLKFNLPFGSVGFGVGLKYKF